MIVIRIVTIKYIIVIVIVIVIVIIMIMIMIITVIIVIVIVIVIVMLPILMMIKPILRAPWRTTRARTIAGKQVVHVLIRLVSREAGCTCTYLFGFTGSRLYMYLLVWFHVNI